MPTWKERRADLEARWKTLMRGDIYDRATRESVRQCAKEWAELAEELLAANPPRAKGANYCVVRAQAMLRRYEEIDLEALVHRMVDEAKAKGKL